VISVHDHGATAGDAVSEKAASPGRELHEDELIARLASGDRQALKEIYDLYAGAAYTQALMLLHDPQEAQDLVQEAFLAVWRHAGSFDPRRGTVMTWLLSIVRHRALDILRGARYKCRMAGGDEQLLVQRDPVQVEGEALRHYERGQLWTALAGLPTAQRQAVELAYFGGYQYPEIARILGLPLGTVKSRLRIALHKLRAAPEIQGLQRVG
jgi:RNA polymerase sigma factor (sigma-70 family)